FRLAALAVALRAIGRDADPLGLAGQPVVHIDVTAADQRTGDRAGVGVLGNQPRARAERDDAAVGAEADLGHAQGQSRRRVVGDVQAAVALALGAIACDADPR